MKSETNLCGYVYTHASGYQEECGLEKHALFIAHGRYRPVPVTKPIMRQYAKIRIKVAIIQEIEDLNIAYLLDEYRIEGAAELLDIEVVRMPDTNMSQKLDDLVKSNFAQSTES